MKFYTIILSLIILCMAVMPCTDALSCDSPEMIMSADHDHSEDQDDECAPFCVCQCCGINIGFSDVKELSLNHKDHLFTYTFSYHFNYSYDHLGSMWHPPALV